jgi:hypothetical protein
VATRCGGGAAQRHSLSTGHPDGAPVLLEEDAATVTKLLFVRERVAGKKIKRKSRGCGPRQTCTPAKKPHAGCE